MKHILYVVVLVFGLQSCKLTDNKAEEVEVEHQESKELLKAIDKDENGCLASAGYIWSKLNKECVKLFTGIQLNPKDKPQNEDETLSAYIMFSEDNKQAEIFFPNTTETYILSRNSNDQPWVNNDWQLIQSNGFVLKQGDKVLFLGDDFIGKKVVGSDTEGK